MAAFITGRIDGYDPESATLTDYKTARRLPSSMRAHHHRQVHLYAWLLARNGFGVPAAIRILYISMANVRSFDVAVPTEAELVELEADLLERVRRILAEDPPEAVPEADWECKYCGFTQCPTHPEKADSC